MVKKGNQMKKLLSYVLVAALALTGASVLASCGGDNSASKGDAINPITREEGSGTRGAFIELFGLEVKDGDKKVDTTTADAAVAKSTAEVLTKIAGDEDGIGYISLGSLNNSVKAVKIDGVEPTVANIRSDEYKIHRPFNIVLPANSNNEIVADFLKYIESNQGQGVVQTNGYIASDDAPVFTPSTVSGKITVSGSSSVSPLMEKLIEAYKVVNPNVEISLNTSDSTTGINDAIEGRSDIGMASRELKDSELAKGVLSTQIATDGLAVIANLKSAVDSLTKDQVKGIFDGSIKSFEELAK